MHGIRPSIYSAIMYSDHAACPRTLLVFAMVSYNLCRDPAPLAVCTGLRTDVQFTTLFTDSTSQYMCMFPAVLLAHFLFGICVLPCKAPWARGLGFAGKESAAWLRGGKPLSRRWPRSSSRVPRSSRLSLFYSPPA